MYKLLLLIALPFSAFSQIINLPKPGPAKLDGATVCLTLPVAAKVRDSLTVLPLVRKETQQLRKAVDYYRSAADSARASYLSEAQAAANLGTALQNQKIETTRARIEARKWKRKAQWRTVWRWVERVGWVAVVVAVL